MAEAVEVQTHKTQMFFILTTQQPGQYESAAVGTGNENQTDAEEEEESAAEKAEEAPSDAEENIETPEKEGSGDQEVVEGEPEINLETAPADIRFPTTNQTRHCFTRYIEYHRCIAAKGEGAPECQKYAKYYRSLCPGEWVERWNEQRENGTFPGPL